MNDFYDRMASLYHLIFPDWDESIERQAGQLAGIIQDRWGGGARAVLDVSCGIGTQALGLSRRGFAVTASDLSAGAVARARDEARHRGLAIDFSVCDMRAAHAHHRQQFDVVISCDNSITHLLTDDDLLLARRQMYACTRPGGGCLLTVRDYDREERGRGLVKPYGVREEGGQRYVVFQVWDFVGDLYDLAMYFVVDDLASGELVTHDMRTRYNAVGTAHLLELMRRAGFTKTERLDGRFYQPVLVGDREGGAGREGDSMPTEENKLLVRRYIEEVVNTGNVDDLARFISPDYIDSHDRSGQSNGLEGARRHILGVRQTYPDLQVTVEQQIAEGEWVVSRITARGTHLGMWLGMKPTGRRVEITGVNIDRVVGGRIVEHGGAANLLGPLLEIGAIRVVGDEDCPGVGQESGR